MKRTNILILLLSGLSLCSCSDFLDEETKNVMSLDQFYRNEGDARQAINGIYGRVKSPDVTSYNTRQIPTDLTKRATWDEGGGLIDYTFGADNSYIEAMWVEHYAVIKDCNSAIDNIMANKDRINNWERYVAQARGVRAYLYFDLVRWFGDVPLIVESEKSLTGDLSVARTDQTLVFQQIIDDFKYCADHSMEKGDTENGYQYGRMTVDAAYGFLAKVYLWLGSVAARDGEEVLGSAEDNFELAMNYAQTVIESGHYSLVEYYPDVFNAKTMATAMSEILWCTVGVTGDGTGSWTGMMFGITGDANYGASWGNISGTDYHRMMYEPADSVRRLWNCPRVIIQEDGTLWGWDYEKYKVHSSGDPSKDLTKQNEKTNYIPWCIGKFRRYPVENLATYNYTNFGMNEPLLRYADVLLIYAEAYNEVHKGPGEYHSSAGLSLSGNGISSAFDAVNLVRKRARYAVSGSDIHSDELPRMMTYENIDKVDTHIRDWKPSSYGLDSQGADIWSSQGYASDYEAFRAEILNERARELVAETTDRWCDLVRRGMLVEVMQKAWRRANPFIGGATERNISAVSAPENVSEKHYLLPIPLRELDVNSKLVQNPGY